MNNKYTIGLDFGTLSGRAVIVDVSNGEEIASSVMDYPHGVMDKVLAHNSMPLPTDTALQDPQDYLLVLEHILNDSISKANIDINDIIGVGIDFTTCTMLPVSHDGTPLCAYEKFADCPHAYAKLWKHHTAQPYADIINKTIMDRGEEWIAHFGGKISSEWLFPKIYETLDRAPQIYENAAYFIEAGDWLAWQLTGIQKRSYIFASYKAQYDIKNGYPSEEFFGAVDKRLKNVVRDKLNAPIIKANEAVGNISTAAAKKYNLTTNVAVACPFPDAHVATPALGVCRAGEMFGIFGTSACFMLLSDKNIYVPGICGYIEDGLFPGYLGYEAGLCCTGDLYSWFAENLCPASYAEEAKAKGISPLRLLIEKAATKKPGQGGIIALDWWNGNRNILVDANLTGLLIGMTLQTKAEDILRALIEATAFATRIIIENYREHGVTVNKFVAGGGIARKDPFTMQMYADILGFDIQIAGSSQIPALASAIFATVAAGEQNGGYATIEEASERMKNVSETVYHPNKEAGDVYDKLFAEYKTLHDYFGRGGNNVMKRLKNISAN